MEISVRDEFGRFLRLYEQLNSRTHDWIVKMPRDRLDWVPIDNPNLRFGDRVSMVTVKNLYIHIAVEENHWISFLAACSEDAVVPVSQTLELAAQMAIGDFVANVLGLHRETFAMLKGFTNPQLRKVVRYYDRVWSVMGFLWGIYAHHAYHLGHIDMYLRQSNTEPPNLFHFSGRELA